VLFLGLLIGIFFGAGGLALVAHYMASKTPISTQRDATKVPVQSNYHGGSVEKYIMMPELREGIDRLVSKIKWTAEYDEFVGMNFFTIDLTNPTKVLVGRHHEIGDMVGDQMVVHREGLQVKLMPTHEALIYLSEEAVKTKEQLKRDGVLKRLQLESPESLGSGDTVEARI
jgi:hypothetical protein